MMCEELGRILGIGLDRRDYESEQYINRRTEAYHKATGRYLSKDEAIVRLKQINVSILTPAEKTWNKRAFEYRTMKRFLTNELAKLINLSFDSDPVRIIYRFMNDMDDISVLSDRKIVWNYAGLMRDAAQDILDLL